MFPKRVCVLPSHKRRSKSVWKMCDLMPRLKCVVNGFVSTDNKGFKDCGQRIPVCLDTGTNGRCQVIGTRAGKRRRSGEAEGVMWYRMVPHALLLLCCCSCSQGRLCGKGGSDCGTAAALVWVRAEQSPCSWSPVPVPALAAAPLSFLQSPRAFANSLLSSGWVPTLHILFNGLFF